MSIQIDAGGLGEYFFDPRVVEFQGMEGIKLGDVIELLIDSQQPTRVAVNGPTSHLAVDWIKRRYRGFTEICWEVPPQNAVLEFFSIHSNPAVTPSNLELKLAPLDQDDVIRFLLNNFPASCQSVITRLKPNHYQKFGSDLCIWSRLLGLLAQHQELSVEEALWDLLILEIEEYFKRKIHGLTLGDQYRELLSNETPPTYQFLYALQSIPSNFTRLKVENVMHQLRVGDRRALVDLLDRDAIIELGQRLKKEPELIEALRGMTIGKTASMATSILHQMQIQWRPTVFSECNMFSAQYDQAKWPRIWLTESQFSSCNFSESCLTNASLSMSSLQRCSFPESDLAGLKSFATEYNQCDFRSCQLTRSSWKNGKVRQCNYAASNLAESNLEKMEFFFTSFSRTSFAKACLDNCHFTECSFDQADLFFLRATSTIFERCRLKHANLEGVVLHNCNLPEMNLEDTEHRSLNFERCSLGDSILTGSKLYKCSFANSDLHGSRMADAEWLECDLRGADLRGVVFHFGSTRCGMVGSPYPSHGTRTGFYTDQLEEQYFREPEEIRRAALINCDLGGANLEGVDFYLVDLTGSKLDRQYYRQAIATGALGISDS